MLQDLGNKTVVNIYTNKSKNPKSVQHRIVSRNRGLLPNSKSNSRSSEKFFKKLGPNPKIIFICIFSEKGVL